ncbi:unnamed protein product [Chondrus crispus]|uniref:Uncharacterized protein n=1 Tax=Chondrus crispus TaxID=2769 RepID=R7QN74_CHOCR|nr:unnamed protein product [Chondrus crispus]CDF39529.1 unnamed protein product [Chondrus crispus]|eukprot:XP_005713441.1 unnamed protein product [Chondrus crispus]
MLLYSRAASAPAPPPFLNIEPYRTTLLRLFLRLRYLQILTFPSTASLLHPTHPTHPTHHGSLSRIPHLRRRRRPRRRGPGAMPPAPLARHRQTRHDVRQSSNRPLALCVLPLARLALVIRTQQKHSHQAACLFQRGLRTRRKHRRYHHPARRQSPCSW